MRVSPGRWGEPGRVGCVRAGCRSPSRGRARAASRAGAGCRGRWELVGSSSSSVRHTQPRPCRQHSSTQLHCQWEWGGGCWRGNSVQKPLPHLPADPRPQVLVLPKPPERFPRCRLWAGRVSRPPHWCVPMPAAGCGARTGLCQGRAGQGAAGAPGAAPLAAAWAGRR